jgi:hypothetical protein
MELGNGLKIPCRKTRSINFLPRDFRRRILRGQGRSCEDNAKQIDSRIRRKKITFALSAFARATADKPLFRLRADATADKPL